jgi:hypothetical protein
MPKEVRCGKFKSCLAMVRGLLFCGSVSALLLDSNSRFVELYRGGRTTDYPFGCLQVKLDAKGQGSGQIMAAARIRFNKKEGKYEIESYGNQYIKAVNVRPSK